MVATSLRVEGAEQFFALGKRLRQAGDKELRRELYRGLNSALKPLRAAIKKSAVDTLPSGGGLGATVAAETKIRVQRRTGARSVGIKLIGRWGDHDIKAIDRGRIRHPLFDNRSRWFTQAVTPGWWTTPTGSSAPVIRENLLVAMNSIRHKIEG